MALSLPIRSVIFHTKAEQSQISLSECICSSARSEKHNSLIASGELEHIVPCNQGKRKRDLNFLFTPFFLKKKKNRAGGCGCNVALRRACEACDVLKMRSEMEDSTGAGLTERAGAARV